MSLVVQKRNDESNLQSTRLGQRVLPSGLSLSFSLSLSLSLSFYSFTVYALALVYEILTAEGDSLSRRLATSEYRHN